MASSTASTASTEPEVTETTIAGGEGPPPSDVPPTADGGVAGADHPILPGSGGVAGIDDEALPRTGTDSAPLAALGTTLALLGGAVLVVRRRLVAPR